MIPWLLSLSLAAAQPAACPEAPLRAGEEAVLQWRDTEGRVLDGVTLRAHHRPGLPSATETSVGITDGAGSLTWTPSEAGPTRIKVDGHGACSVHIAWPRPPLSGALPAALVLLASVLWMAMPRQGPAGGAS